MGIDGSPRAIPIGFWWTGEQQVLTATVPTSAKAWEQGVVRRLIDAYGFWASLADDCPACAAPRRSMPCPNCGACSWGTSTNPWHLAGARPSDNPGGGLPWPLIWHRAVRRETTVGGGRIAEFRVEYTPTSLDGRFGIFQLYVRGVALGDATTTGLHPHVQDMRRLCEAAEVPGAQDPEALILGDTFDHLDITVEITEFDMIFAFVVRQGWGALPSWAAAGTKNRLTVRRTEVVDACREAEPEFRKVLDRR